MAEVEAHCHKPSLEHPSVSKQSVPCSRVCVRFSRAFENVYVTVLEFISWLPEI